MSNLSDHSHKVFEILGVYSLPESMQLGVIKAYQKIVKKQATSDHIEPLQKDRYDTYFSLSMALKLVDIGPICALLISAPTIDEWLDSINEYSEYLGFDKSFFKITKNNSHCTCRLKLTSQNNCHASRYTIFELGLFFRLYKYSFGEELKGIKGSFPDILESTQIENISKGFEIIDTNPNSEVVLKIPKTLLSHRLPDSNQKISKIFRRNIERSHKPQTVINSVTKATLNAIRNASSFADANQKEIAMQLCISERTLVRRLQADGVTFRELFKEVRNVKALELLFAGQSVESISTYLGFSERSTFERAFKKWQRVTPVAMQSRFSRLNNESALDSQIKAEQIPNLPGIASRLLKLLNDDKSHMNELIDLVENDPVLVAKILNIANSGAYGHLKANSVKSAILTILGTEKLQSIALSILSTDAFNLDSTLFNYRSYWLRSLSVAKLSESISKSCRKSQQEESNSVYLNGLLHNIGELVIAFCLPKGYADIQKESPNDLSFDQILGLQSLRLGINTLEASSFLAKVWKLPDSTVTALETLAEKRNAIEFAKTDTLSQAIKLFGKFDQIDTLLRHKQKNQEILPIINTIAKELEIDSQKVEKWYQEYLKIKQQAAGIHKRNVH